MQVSARFGKTCVTTGPDSDCAPLPSPKSQVNVVMWPSLSLLPLALNVTGVLPALIGDTGLKMKEAAGGTLGRSSHPTASAASSAARTGTARRRANRVTLP